MVFDDSTEWFFIDKLGHCWSTYLITNLLMIWRVGTRYQCASAAFLMVSSIEIADGFSVAYGMSFYDVGANLAGAVLAVLLPWKYSDIRFKFSFWPSEWAIQRPDVLGAHWYEVWLKDYNGQTYWLSFPLFHKLWPKYAPKWLAVGVGFGADGMLFGQSILNALQAYEVFFAPDIMFSAIKVRNRVLRNSFYVLDAIKWPAGALIWHSLKGWLWGI